MRSRPKWLLIRPSQKKATSDQTDPDRRVDWLDYRALETPCALEKLLWLDYCALESHTLIRHECARICLWSDWSALEITSDKSKVRSKLPLFRLKCVQNILIREWFWSWTNLSISPYYIHFMKNDVIILYSINEKPILNVLLMKIKQKNVRKNFFWVCHNFMYLTE